VTIFKIEIVDSYILHNHDGVKITRLLLEIISDIDISLDGQVRKKGIDRSIVLVFHEISIEVSFQVNLHIRHLDAKDRRAFNWCDNLEVLPVLASVVAWE